MLVTMVTLQAFTLCLLLIYIVYKVVIVPLTIPVAIEVKDDV